MRTLLNVLEENAVKFPLKLALIWINSKGEYETKVTYNELIDLVHRFAFHLKEKIHLTNGDKAILLYSPSLDFIITTMLVYKLALFLLLSHLDIQNNYLNISVKLSEFYAEYYLNE